MLLIMLGDTDEIKETTAIIFFIVNNINKQHVAQRASQGIDFVIKNIFATQNSEKSRNSQSHVNPAQHPSIT